MFKLLRKFLGSFAALASISFTFSVCLYSYLLGLSNSLNLIKAVLLSTVIVIFLRTIVNKKRPKYHAHKNFLEKVNSRSFPSHHASRASILFLYFTNLFGLMKYNLAILFLVLISRQISKKHDFWDIIAGFCIGFLSFWFFNY